VQFNSLSYFVFLAVVFVVYWTTVRLRWFPSFLLLVASYVFYGSWNRWYLLLIFTSSTVDWFCAGRLALSTEPVARKRWLIFLICYNLGILSVFKYFNFFMDSATSLVRVAGLDLALPHSSLILPAGISFFTFQSMSYAIDVYRREIEPEPSYLRYLTFVAFFPQLLAGPIVRAHDLLPALRNRPALTDEMGGRGLALIAIGLFKKVLIADYLAVNLVDRTFDLPYQFSSVEMLAGVYGYALQIYCDFSGYTDIAIGTALLLGIRFPLNFDAPYQSKNLQEFWRRWHISLSSWLRDYLYVSLGGNRGGRWKTYRNLLLTMLLGGLWHGASWNFVIWGALHGGALAVLRFWQERRDAAGLGPLLRGRFGGLGTPLAVFATFNFVCLAWVFFRAHGFGEARDVLARIFAFEGGTTNLTGPLLLVMGVGFATHFWPRAWFESGVRRFVALPAFAQAAGLVAMGFGLREVVQAKVVPFIYFQF
jgi:alginate O-acetyltransferase complex protein AlgI